MKLDAAVVVVVTAAAAVVTAAAAVAAACRLRVYRTVCQVPAPAQDLHCGRSACWG